MAAEIEASFPGATVELIGGGRGDFIVKRDDEIFWDKRNVEGRFPDDGEVVARLR